MGRTEALEGRTLPASHRRSLRRFLSDLTSPIGHGPGDPDLDDPPEPWETAVSREEAARIGSAGLRGRPYRPQRFDDMPAGARDALEDVCGVLRLNQLFVVPRTARWTNRAGRQCVATPAEVVAFGATIVALWVDDPIGAGVRVVVPVDHLAAIVERNILLYGRAALIAADASIVIRYNTVAETDLRDSFRRVRMAIAGPPVPTPAVLHWPGHSTHGQVPVSELPFKWQFVVASRVVNLGQREPMTVAVGGIDRAHARGIGIAVLGSRELVIVTDPTEDVRVARHGFDVHTVPRARLRSLGWDGNLLTVRAGLENKNRSDDKDQQPAVIGVQVDRSLGEAMREAFASAVRWD